MTTATAPKITDFVVAAYQYYVGDASRSYTDATFLAWMELGGELPVGDDYRAVVDGICWLVDGDE